jgi:ankyrin repeat protein
MDAREIPARPDIEQYKKQAKELVKAYSGDAKALQKIVERFRPGREITLEEFRAAISSRLNNNSGEIKDSLALSDAQFIVAREHAFESWPKFVKHLSEVNVANSPVSIFENAADAIVDGDAKTLKRLLRENPGLIHERSDREHRSTLLHYLSANGVEDFRQKTPKNIARIARILLDAGAEVDAMSDAYGGGSTALNLTASSLHPAEAGVMDDLIEVLIEYGAAIDGYPDGWSPVMAAIANGQIEAAETLARLGARVDNIVAAAALGQMETVKSFYKKDGSLKAAKTVRKDVPQDLKKRMDEAFTNACLYGRTAVAEFMLKCGIALEAADGGAQTGLHMAAYGGHLDTVKMLLQWNAPLEVKNSYDGTPLSTALWAAYNNTKTDHPQIVETLIAAGAKIDPDWQQWIDKLRERK